jgi:hypothetical protein
MPLFEENTKPENTKPTADELGKTTATAKKPESNLMTIIGQCLPFAPLVFEQFTGQKVPQLSGTMAEITNSLQQIQINLQTIANNQAQLAQRLIALETNANNHLTNLTQQFQSLRLTHTKERKEIEYNPNKLTDPESY